MFDLPLPIQPTAYARGVPPHFPSDDADHSHPFALTLSRRAPADLMSGRAAPLVLARFATLAGAMQGAIDHAEGIRAARKRFYQQMLCAHAARQAAGDRPTG